MPGEADEVLEIVEVVERVHKAVWLPRKSLLSSVPAAAPGWWLHCWGSCAGGCRVSTQVRG